MSLGCLDVASEGPSSPPSLASQPPSIQIIKFPSPSATNGLSLRGWLSWYSVVLPFDAAGAGGVVDGGRDQLLRHLRGPRYPTMGEKGGDSNVEWFRRLAHLPREVWTRQRLQYGWAQEPRKIKISREAGDDREEEQEPADAVQ